MKSSKTITITLITGFVAGILGALAYSWISGNAKEYDAPIDCSQADTEKKREALEAKCAEWCFKEGYSPGDSKVTSMEDPFGEITCVHHCDCGGPMLVFGGSRDALEVEASDSE